MEPFSFQVWHIQPRSAGSREEKNLWAVQWVHYCELSWSHCKDCWTAVPVIKHHKWCWTVVLGGRPSIKWDMACEGCLSPQAFAAGQKRGIGDMLWENSKTLYNIPLLVLQEVTLDTGSVNAFSSLLRGFHFKLSLYRTWKILHVIHLSSLMKEVCKQKWYVLEQLKYLESGNSCAALTVPV